MKAAFFLLLFTVSSLIAQDATFVQPTAEELASVLGIKPFCWDIASAEPCYARLVARAGDAEQTLSLKGATNPIRVRIFVITDSGTGKISHVTYSLEGAKGERSQGLNWALSVFEIKSLTGATEPAISVTVEGQSRVQKPVTLSLKVETSKDPFPPAPAKP